MLRAGWVWVCLMVLVAGVRAQSVDVNGAGATFPSKVYEQWAQRYALVRPDVSVRYRPVGSGKGIRSMQAREVMWAGTDSPLTPDQLRQQRLVQIPMVVGGLVPVVNLKGVDEGALVLDGEVLADIMLGDIRRWSDRRIEALNPRLSLPDLPIVRVVREDASGSSEVWSRWLGLASPRFAEKVPASQKPSWPGQVLAENGNDGVVARVQAMQGALGYVSYDRVLRDRLTDVRLRTRSGAVVAASEAAFRSAMLASDVYRQGDDLASLLDMPRPDAWPVTATTYVLIDAAPQDLRRATAAARFIYWCFMQGDALTRGTGFAPLPARVQARLAPRLMQVRDPQGQALSFQTP